MLPATVRLIHKGAEPEKKRERSAKSSLVVQFHPAAPSSSILEELRKTGATMIVCPLKNPLLAVELYPSYGRLRQGDHETVHLLKHWRLFADLKLLEQTGVLPDGACPFEPVADGRGQCLKFLPGLQNEIHA